MLEFKIVEKAQFTVIGKGKRFNVKNSYEKIPEFWQEFMQSGDKTVCGTFGVCMDGDDEFDYYIADIYLPYNEIPDGYKTLVFAAGAWAVFPCRGELPKALQDINDKIWSEWLPSCKEYKLAGNYSIEAYVPSPDDDGEYSEIWIPVKKV